MAGLMRWRLALRRGEAPGLSRARTYSAISRVQAVLVVTMVFVAAFMARGFGQRH